MDNDDRYISSLKLVQTAHAICDFWRQQLQEMQSNPGLNPQWRGKSLYNLALLLLHMYQTNAQQMLLCWLGITHGHLHPYNTVSRVKSDQQVAQSPLETRIIDFDKAQISVKKMADNDELYQIVDSARVLSRIKDTQLNINLRLLFVMYLPLQNWDDQVFALLRAHTDNPLLKQIMRLISARAQKDLTNTDLFNKFAQFIYHCERTMLDLARFPAFRCTISLVTKSKVNIHDAELKTLQQYASGGLAAVDLGNLTAEGQLLLISAVHFLHCQDYYLAEDSLTSEEINWALNLIDQSDLIAAQARRVIWTVIDSYAGLTIKTLSVYASLGDSDKLELTKRLLNFAFTQAGEAAARMHRHLVGWLYDVSTLNFAVNLIDFALMPADFARTAYNNFCIAVSNMPDYLIPPAQRKETLAKLRQRFESMGTKVQQST